MLRWPAIGASSLTATSRPSSGRGGGHPCPRTVPAAALACVQRLVVVGLGERVDGRLDRLGPGDHRRDQLDRRQLPGPEQAQRARSPAGSSRSSSRPLTFGVGAVPAARAALASSPAAARSRAAAWCRRCCGSSSTCARRPALDHLPAVHHDRVVGELADHGEVVADQDVGHGRSRRGCRPAGSAPGPGSTRPARRRTRPGSGSAARPPAPGRSRPAAAARRTAPAAAPWTGARPGRPAR